MDPNTHAHEEEVHRCIGCMDTFSVSKLIPCTRNQHWCCKKCLQDLLRFSYTGHNTRPVTCCDQPWPVLDEIVGERAAVQYRTRRDELATPAAQRTYCHAPACGLWIPPSRIEHQTATCSCQATTCTLCKGQLHPGSDCPKDPKDKQLAQMATEHGWKWCYACNALVEKNDGCDHMSEYFPFLSQSPSNPRFISSKIKPRCSCSNCLILCKGHTCHVPHDHSLHSLDRDADFLTVCRCGAEFCYSCGNKWRSLANPDRGPNVCACPRNMMLGPPAGMLQNNVAGAPLPDLLLQQAPHLQALRPRIEQLDREPGLTLMQRWARLQGMMAEMPRMPPAPALGPDALARAAREFRDDIEHDQEQGGAQLRRPFDERAPGA